jgi:hydrogenase nickel incorporation protein HypA/HybF
MHELSIALSIIEIAEENARRENATVVKNIELDIGTQSGIVLEALEFAMESAVRNTMLEHAKVIINTISARAECNKCAHVFYTEDLFSPCPECGNPFSEIIQGRELKVKSLIVE